MRSLLHPIEPSLCFVAVLLLAPIQNVMATFQGDVLFHVSFDAGVNPVFARGDRTVTTTGHSAFVEGKIGRALTCKGDATSIVYKSKGNFDIRVPSLAMSIKPVGWTCDKKVR